MTSPSTLGSPSLPSTSHQPLRSYLFNPFHNIHPHTHSPGPHPHSLSFGPPPHSFLIPPSRPISGMPFSMAISLHKMSWPLKKNVLNQPWLYAYYIMHLSFITLLTFYFAQHVTLSYNSKCNACHTGAIQKSSPNEKIFFWCSVEILFQH